MIAEILTGPDHAFYKNLFMNMDYRSSNRVTPSFQEHNNCNNQSRKEQLIEMIDVKKFKASTTHEIGLLMQMSMGIVFSTITNAYKHLNEEETYDLSEAIQDFQTKMEWLKHGVYK